MFPANFDRYIEVFGGGGWVLFGKPPDDRCMEVYNDYNSNLANLFYCVKNRTGAFLKELGFLPLNSRDEFTVIRKFIEKQEPDTRFLIEELELAEKYLLPPDYEEVKKILLENAEVTDVKRAAAFFKLIRYSYGSGCTSYSCRPFDVRNCFDTIWQASRRLADTVIENKDFEALIRQYDRDSAFFYCDPPYYETEGHYAVVFRKEDHKRLRDTLTGSRGKWMVSYNDCDFIRELYALLFNVLSFMSDELLTQGNTAASLDEFYLFLSNLTAVEYVRNFMKRVRKKDSAVIIASQNLEDFNLDGVKEYTKPLFSIPTHQFLFNAGSIDAKFYTDTLQLEDSEYNLIRYPQRGVCLYKCGNERYNLMVHAPEHKAKLFGKAGGR